MSEPREEFDFDAIGEGVLRELNRRIQDPKRAADLPGTHLMQLAQMYAKILQKRNEIEEQKVKEKVDPITVIDQEGLPLALRIEILTSYLDDLEEAWRSASQRMVELMEMKEVEDDVPEMPALQ